tara:strand:+ start:120 stop:416 length:297 start_codon:yes stop_codon:yes gene_type:complete
MRQEKINQLLKDNYKIKVFIKINNRSNGMVLNTWIYKNNNCYEVYYNHIKTHLNDHQLRFIKAYQIAKKINYKELVFADMDVKTMYSAMKKLEYLEQN